MKNGGSINLPGINDPGNDSQSLMSFAGSSGPMGIGGYL
jgi:hypothetical protein